MKYDEVRARGLACRLRSLDMDSASETVGDMITEIDRLRKALQEIADLGQDDESCAGFIAYKALNTK